MDNPGEESATMESAMQALKEGPAVVDSDSRILVQNVCPTCKGQSLSHFSNNCEPCGNTGVVYAFTTVHDLAKAMVREMARMVSHTRGSI